MVSLTTAKNYSASLSEGGKSPTLLLLDYDSATGNALLLDLKQKFANELLARLWLGISCRRNDANRGHCFGAEPR